MSDGTMVSGERCLEHLLEASFTGFRRDVDSRIHIARFPRGYDVAEILVTLEIEFVVCRAVVCHPQATTPGVVLERLRVSAPGVYIAAAQVTRMPPGVAVGKCIRYAKKCDALTSMSYTEYRASRDHGLY
ncbi:hypothetical protein ALC60_05089 [Trachymyrmex zeteki]|uniref:Uncharacterized protein n=1 Tax=Mycetomoellerius zeteki TaxID=64791 RepID=A0A151X6J7_9HYME|nr:hypothetical protein ALC60_05089 [Trachymyrmex zeteki]